MVRVKALMLTWDYPPAKGGIQIWMFELARRLPDADVRVFAPCTPGDREFDEASGVRVKRVPPSGLGQIAWLVKLATRTMAACLAEPPDVIVCGHVITAPAALAVGRLLGIPYVVLTHAWEIRRKRHRSVVSRVLKNAALVTANSRFTECSVLRHGVSPDRVRLLYPGTDATRFAPAARRGARVNGRPTILTVARLDELYKGHDTVIRSLPLVKAKCPDIRYVVIGDGRLRGYLGRLAASLGVEQHVAFLGNVSDDALPEVYRNADVFVQMSREARSGGGAEGFGIVCLEAAASGLPVIAGRSGGLPDAVVDGVTGLLVDPEDYGIVAESIAAVLNDPGLAQRLGEAGRLRVTSDLTWDRMAGRARELFAEACARRGA